MLDYYDVGIDHFLIRGFDPLEDSIHYGRELIPVVRQLVAERESTKVPEGRVISEPVSRRQSLALLSSLALAACSRADAAPVLKVGSQKAGTKALIVSSGVLADAPYQVEWSEFPAAQPLLEAVGSGAIDVGLAGDAPFQFAYQNGSPIKAIRRPAQRSAAARRARHRRPAPLARPQSKRSGRQVGGDDARVDRPLSGAARARRGQAAIRCGAPSPGWRRRCQGRVRFRARSMPGRSGCPI